MSVILKRLFVLISAGVSALALFAAMISIPRLFASGFLSAAPAASGTIWTLQTPYPDVWVTTTQSITVQVQVTNDQGVRTDLAVYQATGLNGVPSTGVPQVTAVSTQSVILAISDITLSEGSANIVTFSVGTSDTNDLFPSQAYTLPQDSVPPTATILSPTGASQWQLGDVVSITYAMTDVTSGLSTTQVWFRLAPISSPVLITATSATAVSWTVPVTQSSSAAQVVLHLSDMAGNQADVASPSFWVNRPITTYAYLPALLLRYPCDNQSADWCEPNNSPATAFPLALNYQITASINMSTDRYDYYRVTLNSGQPHTITVRLVPPCADPTPKCDLDLYLLDSTSPYTYVGSSAVPNIGNEQIITTPTTSNDYIVLVYDYATTITPTQYTLIAK
ncbi:MAG: hypothetical protein M1434_12745 [Chloroflexi bacterium]|nr:hypothetical protein [Chloroflexota bacterium]MCL5275591.1 hypothetical protein [Chloroflexota bacterium]